MIVTCPRCGKQYRMDDRYKSQPGLSIKCPACQERFALGEPPSAPGGEPGQGQPQTVPQGASGPAQPPSAGGRRILVADDSPFFRSMVGDLLTGEGYEVVYAEDGEDALAKVRDLRPDLLILDLQLPKILGFDVIRHIRNGQIRPDLPILVMSSVFTRSAEVSTLAKLGANEFIDKQFKPSYLTAKVRLLLGKE